MVSKAELQEAVERLEASNASLKRTSKKRLSIIGELKAQISEQQDEIAEYEADWAQWEKARLEGKLPEQRLRARTKHLQQRLSAAKAVSVGPTLASVSSRQIEADEEDRIERLKAAVVRLKNENAELKREVQRLKTVAGEPIGNTHLALAYADDGKSS